MGQTDKACVCTWVVPDHLDPHDLDMDALGLGLLWKVQAQCSRGSEDGGNKIAETAITERRGVGEGQGQDRRRERAREQTRARWAVLWTASAEGRGAEDRIKSKIGEPGSGGRQASRKPEERQDQPEAAEREVQAGRGATVTAATATAREANRNLKVSRWWAERQSDTDGCCIS